MREPGRREESESADHPRDEVEVLGTAPEQDQGLGRRLVDLNTCRKVAVVGGVLLVVAGVGIIVLPDHAGFLGLGPAPSATPDVGPPPSEPSFLPFYQAPPDLGPEPTVVDNETNGLHRRYSLTLDPRGPAPPGTTRSVAFSFSFSEPSEGWEHFGSLSLNKSAVGPQDAEGVLYWAAFPSSAFVEACVPPLGSLVPRPTPDIAASLATAAGIDLVTGPSEVKVGGYTAQHLVFTVREDRGCDPGYLFTWETGLGGAFWPGTEVGDTIRVWIIEVAPKRGLFIVGETKPKDSVLPSEADAYDPRKLGQEIEQIVGSIRFS